MFRVPWLTAAVAVAAMFSSACGGDGGASGTAATASTTSASTAAPTTTDPSPGTSVVVEPTDPLPEPRHVDDIPQVTPTPGAGVAGDRIRLVGSGFTDGRWTTPNGPLWLVSGETGCALYAPAEHTLTVDADGVLTGHLTVPSSGGCRMSIIGELPVEAGTYLIAFQCTVCFIGEVEVTADPAAPARCADVGWTPNSDHVASYVTASGLPCSEAEALVRSAETHLSTTFDLSGFHCMETGRDDDGLPAVAFECTRDGQRITFLAT